MGIAANIIVAYLLAGIATLSVFDIVTHRIRNKWRTSSMEMQDRLAQSGNLIGSRSAMIALFIAMWLFWPFVLIGAAVNK